MNIKSVMVVGCTLVGLGQMIHASEGGKGPVIDEKILQENYANLERQNVVVTVLANQYNKELTELQRMEAIFCDHYKISVDKWRKGLYEWSSEKKEFIEKSAEQAQ